MLGLNNMVLKTTSLAYSKCLADQKGPEPGGSPLGGQGGWTEGLRRLQGFEGRCLLPRASSPGPSPSTAEADSEGLGH